MLSCNSQKKVERENEPTIYNVQDDDKEMNEAMKTAQKTLANFDDAFKKNNDSNVYFSLKKRFEEDNIIEHIWIGNLKYENGKYIGIVGNLPEKLKSVKLDDTVEIERKDITDWMYIINSKLYGGYTVRLLRNRMTESERQKFDSENGLIIEE